MSGIALVIAGGFLSPISIFCMASYAVVTLLGGYGLLPSIGITMLLMAGLSAAVIAVRSWASAVPVTPGSYPGTEVIFVLVAAWMLQSGLYLDFYEQAVAALDSSSIALAALTVAVGSAVFSTAAFVGGLIGVVVVVSVVSALQLVGVAGGDRTAPWLVRSMQLWLMGIALYVFSGALGELLIVMSAPAAVVGGVSP